MRLGFGCGPLRPLGDRTHARGVSFDDALARAFRELLQTPVRDGEVEVLPGIRGFLQAYLRLIGLPAA